MISVGIDPGTEHSGMVVFDDIYKKVLLSVDVENNKLLDFLHGDSTCLADGTFFNVLSIDDFFIETIEAMGLMVGKSTFETCIWIGRYIEAYEHITGKKSVRVSRGDEKTVICGASTFKNPETGKRKSVGDTQIRAALIERFPATGGGACPQVGTKASPGPLYGVSGHCWQALSVVITGLEIQNSVSTIKEKKKEKQIVVECNDLGF
jgi:hypothetical protein